MPETTFAIPDEMAAPEPVTFSDAPAVDPDAPYGRLTNGRPRKTAPRGSKKDPAAPKPAPAPKPGPPRVKKSAPPADFRPVVAEVVNLLGVALMGIGRKNRAFLADAATVQMHAPELAHAVNEVAKINPVIARALSTTAPAVPYVLLGSALFNMGVQLAANHGRRISAPGVTVHDPNELAAAMEAQMGEAQRQAKEQEAAAAAAQQPAPAEQHAYAGV